MSYTYRGKEQFFSLSKVGNLKTQVSKKNRLMTHNAYQKLNKFKDLRITPETINVSNKS